MYFQINSYISAFWVYWSIFYIRVPQRGETGSDFKTCGDELILDILELQMMSKKKVLGIYIGNFETYTIYSRVADEKKVLGGDCLFKLSKGGDFKKEFKKLWFKHWIVKEYLDQGFSNFFFKKLCSYCPHMTPLLFMVPKGHLALFGKPWFRACYSYEKWG